MTKVFSRFVATLSLLLLLLSSHYNPALAFDEEEKKLLKVRHSHSVRIYPDIVTNLRITNQQNKLKYVFLRMDMIVEKAEDEDIVQMYMPQIKDRVLLFLGKQTASNFTGKRNKNYTQAKLKVVINDVLFKEIKQRLVTEIIFQKVIVE